MAESPQIQTGKNRNFKKVILLIAGALVGLAVLDFLIAPMVQWYMIFATRTTMMPVGL